MGRLVMAVLNFPPEQIGLLMSECLATGFPHAAARSRGACQTMRCAAGDKIAVSAVGAFEASCLHGWS